MKNGGFSELSETFDTRPRLVPSWKRRPGSRNQRGGDVLNPSSMMEMGCWIIIPGEFTLDMDDVIPHPTEKTRDI